MGEFTRRERIQTSSSYKRIQKYSTDINIFSKIPASGVEQVITSCTEGRVVTNKA